MKLNNTIMLALAILFFVLGYNALQDAKPTYKNKRIYTALQPYNPYYLEKRVGGFSILSKEDDIKEKPPITEVYHRLEQLEQGWGMQHLKIVNNKLEIYDNNKKLIKTIVFQNPKEKKWTQQYYNIK